MNAIARTFEDRPAVRDRVPLLIGLMGPSGSGKTFSALRLATGIQAVTGGEVYFIDTEAKRALHYADRFKFRHLEFGAPFGSLDYLAAIEHCVKKGAGVVIVDSMSHEHEGPGGVLEQHERELDRLTRGDDSKRNAMNLMAWAKPKADRRMLINRLTQINCNFIFCFRAKEKAKPVKKDGKTSVENQGWMPIAGEEFVFEQTINCLLLPGSRGVPAWRSDEPGERAMMKLPEQFRHLFEGREGLTEDLGAAMAEWARGDQPVDEEAVKESARSAAKAGTFAAWWKAAKPAERAVVNTIQDEIKRLRDAAAGPSEAEKSAPGRGEDGALPLSASPDPIAAARELGLQHGREGRALRAMPAELREEGRELESDTYRLAHAEGALQALKK